MSNTTTLEEIKTLTDDQLFAILKQHGLSVGPVTSTTRSIYEKKLVKHFKENRESEVSFNKSMVEASVPEQIIQTMHTAESPVKKPAKTVQYQQEPVFIPHEEEESIITHEVRNASLSPSVSSKPKRDDLLEFKLIKDDDFDQFSPKSGSSTSGFSSQTSFPTYDNYAATSSSYDTNPITSRSILINRNQARNQPHMLDSSPKPHINWSSDVASSASGYSLYNAPAPPSPFRKQEQFGATNQAGKSSASTWCKFLGDNLKILAFFLVLACTIYIFIIFLQSYNQENPILDS